MVSIQATFVSLWFAGNAESVGSAMADPFDLFAKTLYQNGETLFNEGRYDDAIFAWKQAWKLSNRPLLLYNIAYALERKGDTANAIDAYYRYRAVAPKAEQPTLIAKIEALQLQLQNKQTESRADDTSQGTTETTSDDHQSKAFELKWMHDSTYLWTSLGLLTVSSLGTGILYQSQSTALKSASNNCANVTATTSVCTGDARQHLNAANGYGFGVAIGYGLTGLAMGATTYFSFKQIERRQHKVYIQNTEKAP